MRLPIYDVSIFVLVISLSLVGAVRSEDGAKVDDVAQQLGKRVARGFGNQANSLPFSSNLNDDLINWSAVWGNPTKRQLNSGVSGLGGSGGLNKGQYQNWNDYFARAYRRPFIPSQRSDGFGSYGGFGKDGLQNWRAFFDHSEGRRFRK